MKSKKFITIFAAILAITATLSLFTACKKNKHDFATEWKYDETYHWHECTTKKHSDTSEKIAHDFDGGEITTQPTEQTKGAKTFTCNTCGYQKVEEVAQLTHVHTFNESKWESDENNHWHAATCAHTDEKKDFAPHTWNDGVITKPSDYGVVGEKKFTCTVCEYSKTEENPALGAKDNEIVLGAGKTLGKKYDGEVISITKDDFVIEGNRAPTIMFKAKGADDNTYTATAPKKAGEYTVKVSVEATAEWQAASDTFDFAITPMVIGVDWEKPYDNTKILTGEPAELLAGDEATITVTMESANVGAAVQSFEITGKDAGNYSLAKADVNVAIIKADIANFTISNAAAFEKGFYVGATNIPDPTTNYVEIGTGYGEKTIVWEQELEGGVWSRNLTKEEVIQLKTGTFRVHIKYAEGDNYKFGDAFVKFTMKAKPRRISVKNFTGKMYDGKPVANFTFNDLVNKFGATVIDGVENFTSATESGEKYLEFRRKGEFLWTKATDVYIPKQAAEFEYRIGVTATDEWEEVVSEVNTFTIKPYEFVLELGYVENQNNVSRDGGKTFLLRTFSAKNGKELIEGQVIALWLNNEIAGLETVKKADGNYYFKHDQKKKVGLDSFFLKVMSSENVYMDNYTVLPKYSNVTTVEMTVVEFTIGKSTSGSIEVVQPTEKSIRTTVVKGYFMVGQTVVVYKKVIVGSDATYVKAGEATITEIRANGTTSASGCAIPSDGKVIIVLDKIYDDIVSGKIEIK